MAQSKALWKGEYRDKRDDAGNLLERVPVESLPGIPAHDLSVDEFAALSAPQQEAVLASPLFEVVGGGPAEPESAPGTGGRTRRGPELASAAEAAATVKDAATITVVSPIAPANSGGTK